MYAGLLSLEELIATAKAGPTKVDQSGLQICACLLLSQNLLSFQSSVGANSFKMISNTLLRYAHSSFEKIFTVTYFQFSAKKCLRYIHIFKKPSKIYGNFSLLL